MSNDTGLTSGGFPKTELLGEDLNRRYLLADTVTKLLPQTQQYYNLIADKAAGITYGKYSFFLAMCYKKNVEEVRKNIEILLNN